MTFPGYAAEIQFPGQCAESSPTEEAEEYRNIRNASSRSYLYSHPGLL